MKPINIIESDGSVRKIGEIIDDVWCKKAKRSKHLMRKLNAWGVDAEVFNNINHLLKGIQIHEVEEDKIYSATIIDFKEYGQYLHFPPHRAQIFLSLNHFKIL